jgi:hypothetical protein
MKLIQGYMWISKEELSALAFSSGHRRILMETLETTCTPTRKCQDM